MKPSGMDLDSPSGAKRRRRTSSAHKADAEVGQQELLSAKDAAHPAAPGRGLLTPEEEAALESEAALVVKQAEARRATSPEPQATGQLTAGQRGLVVRALTVLEEGELLELRALLHELLDKPMTNPSEKVLRLARYARGEVGEGKEAGRLAAHLARCLDGAQAKLALINAARLSKGDRQDFEAARTKVADGLASIPRAQRAEWLAEEKSAAAPKEAEEPTTEEYTRGQMRGELGDRLMKLGFAIVEAGGEEETWGNGANEEVVVGKVGATWSVAGRDTTLSFGDALARAEKQLQEAEQQAEGSGSKSTSKAPAGKRARKKAQSEPEPQKERPEAPTQCGATLQEDDELACAREEGHTGRHMDARNLADGKGHSWDHDARKGELSLVDKRACRAEHPREGWLCRKPKGHDGLHVNCGDAWEDAGKEARKHDGPGPEDAAHTPGPWAVEDMADDGRSKRKALRVVADDDVVVATLVFDREDKEAEESARADAALIAAAPDMRDTLKKDVLPLLLKVQRIGTATPTAIDEVIRKVQAALSTEAAHG